MTENRWRATSGVIGVVGALLIAASQVSPETAQTNIAGWLRIANLDALAMRFSGTEVDQKAAYIGYTALAVAFYGVVLRGIYKLSFEWGRRSERKRMHGSPAKTREYLNPEVTPERLSKLFEGRTDLEGERLAEPYAGKWIKLRGIFENVTRPSVDTDACFLHFEHQWGIGLHLRFDGKKWQARLETLQIGQEVALVGWLGKLKRHSIWVYDCELIPLSEADDAAWVGRRQIVKSGRKGSPRK